MDRLTMHSTPRAGERSATDANAGPTATTSLASTRPTDATAVRDVVRDAIDRGTRLRIVGRGTWLDAGRPVENAQPVSLDALTGIVDYTPGDLTLTARAGTTLAEIAEATRPNGQWLAMAPWGGDRGSLGATAATASAGPTSGTLGTPRDVVIGLEAVTGTGDIVRGGGRVVKNVAGFDLTRLMVGAWGTLGVVTEVSVRLRGLPERDLTVALAAPSGQAKLAELIARLRTAQIAPLALELVDAALATRLAISDASVLLVRLVGNDESVTAQQAVLSELGEMADASGDVWSTLRNVEPRSASVVRLSGSVGRFAETWSGAARVAGSAPGAFAHASVLRSVARVVIPNDNEMLPESAVESLRALTREIRIFERLPASLWSALAPTSVADRISRGIRAAFDPDQLLNPGILGETTA